MYISPYSTSVDGIKYFYNFLDFNTDLRNVPNDSKYVTSQARENSATTESIQRLKPYLKVVNFQSLKTNIALDIHSIP